MSPATAFSTGPDTQPECRPSGWAELFPEHRCRPQGSSSVPHQSQGFCGPGSFQIPLPSSLRCKNQISISLDCTMLRRLTFQKLPFERENKIIFCSWKPKSLSEFWLRMRAKFPTMSQMAPNTPLPICTVHLYELVFSALTIITSGYRAALKNTERAIHQVMTIFSPVLIFI